MKTMTSELNVDQFNGLSPAESERLYLLLEECGEVQQVIGKILRHGYESSHPDGGPTNRGLLEKELGDVLFAVTLMTENADIADSYIRQAAVEKTFKINKYLHHNIIVND